MSRISFSPRVIAVAVILLFFVFLLSGVGYERPANALVKKTPSVVLTASASSITLPCANGLPAMCPSSLEVRLTATIKHFSKRPIYTYTTSGGRIVGKGSEVTWDLSGVAPGSYVASVEVTDEKGHKASSSTTVVAQECQKCVLPCPSVNLTCEGSIKQGAAARFDVVVTGDGHIKRTYNWSISAGEIIQGQGTPSIRVTTAGLAGKTITATVEIGGGFAPECQTVASCTLQVEN